MKITLNTADNKVVVVQPRSDKCLFAAPRISVIRDKKMMDGIDLFYHRSRSGNEYYYLFSWSMNPEIKPKYELISKDQADQFLAEKKLPDS